MNNVMQDSLKLIRRAANPHDEKELMLVSLAELIATMVDEITSLQVRVTALEAKEGGK
jgi:hypothetical protein